MIYTYERRQTSMSLLTPVWSHYCLWVEKWTQLTGVQRSRMVKSQSACRGRPSQLFSTLWLTMKAWKRLCPIQMLLLLYLQSANIVSWCSGIHVSLPVFAIHCVSYWLSFSLPVEAYQGLLGLGTYEAPQEVMKAQFIENFEAPPPLPPKKKQVCVHVVQNWCVY